MKAGPTAQRTPPSPWPAVAWCVVLGLGLWGTSRLVGQPAPETSAAEAVPESATPGYVDDALCSQCHRDVAAEFPSIGMSRAFYEPRRDRFIESFEGASFFHEPSQRHYEIETEGDRMVVRRFQLDPEGARHNVLEEEVDWILGSGSATRSYLYQSAWGELFQMPVAWYTRSAKWGMAPGYDKADHQGFGRRVQRDCMFCHNAYPDVVAGSDVHGEPQIYPEELPEGLGCQRCHGPGEDHVKLAFDLDAPADLVAATVVNPAKLEPQLRDDVCAQCHLQPTVTLSGVRHFDRPIYSYRPGESLDDYLVLMDVVEERPREDRFEINHHPYRLEQSRCFQESPAGAMSCLTCHDPHHKKIGEEAKTVFRQACLGCHTVEACGLEAMGQDLPAHLAEVASDDCTACHMPRRRTQDVIEVTMTDHAIPRRPGGPELTAPIRDVEHRIETVRFLRPERAPEGWMAEVYLQLAMVRSGSKAALDRLGQALDRAAPESPVPYLELAVGQLGAGRFAEAEKTLGEVLKREPEHLGARIHLGVAYAAQGKTDQALTLLEAAVERDPQRPEARFNLAKVLVQTGAVAESLEHFEAAAQSRPSQAEIWLELGNARARLERYEAALAAYRRALAVDPRQRTAQLNASEALLRLGRRDEAAAGLRAWLHWMGDDPQARQRLEAISGP